MLVSHSKKFIFLKTMKTAGTSVEIYLERYCVPPDTYVEQHHRAETATAHGIIGYRGANPAGSTYYNHMPAAELRSLLGPAIWGSYLKIACIRNPFDRVVSAFWFVTPREDRERLHGAPFADIKRAFAAWLSAANPPTNEPVLCIDGQLAVDVLVRHECLLTNLEDLCQRLAIPFEPERLGRFKAESRASPAHFSDYYDAETAARAAELCRLEIEAFGYTLHGAAVSPRRPIRLDEQRI